MARSEYNPSLKKYDRPWFQAEFLRSSFEVLKGKFHKLGVRGPPLLFQAGDKGKFCPWIRTLETCVGINTSSLLHFNHGFRCRPRRLEGRVRGKKGIKSRGHTARTCRSILGFCGGYATNGNGHSTSIITVLNINYQMLCL